MLTFIRLPILVVFVATGLGIAVVREDFALAQDAKTVTVTEKDDGGKIKLNKGDTLVVKLQTQGGTGFTWSIAKNDADLLKQQGKVETEKAEKPKPGGAVTQVYRFRAEAVGTIGQEMHFVRPFEKGKAPAKTFKLTVEIP